MKKPMKLRPVKPDYEGMQLVVGAYSNVTEIRDWVNENNALSKYMCAGTEHPCDTLPHWLEVFTDGRGWIRLSPGDWVVKIAANMFDVQTSEQIEHECIILPLDVDEESDSEEPGTDVVIIEGTEPTE